MEKIGLQKICLDRVGVARVALTCVGVRGSGGAPVGEHCHYVTSDGRHYVTSDGMYYKVKE